jgi:hypothetical protein
MTRLVLPTLAIAAAMLLAGAPLTSSAADYRSKDTPPTDKPDTQPTASNYSGKMPSAQIERDIVPNTSGQPSMWPNWPQQPPIKFSDQAETVFPATPPTDRLGTWSSGPVKMKLTLIERVSRRIEQAFPGADISVMANADEGVVTLMGLVTTKEQKQRAHELVAHIKGVTEVHDELQVIG